jgi:hypothetical protein
MHDDKKNRFPSAVYHIHLYVAPWYGSLAIAEWVQQCNKITLSAQTSLKSAIKLYKRVKYGMQLHIMKIMNCFMMRYKSALFNYLSLTKYPTRVIEITQI